MEWIYGVVGNKDQQTDYIQSQTDLQHDVIFHCFCIYFIFTSHTGCCGKGTCKKKKHKYISLSEWIISLRWNLR